ncbi:hypothetical protein CK500_10935 [Halorubrum salipaludis]|uniref:Uncharacterized protein n=1 Tax=Halorubrum salipaludis TaxID=2032630 RepID=A0A2A2FEB6_9EURY|nr:MULTISPECIES: hypothetical protein [Halorubrum]PAU83298.1 hypothetical protein CK500_10935 [Halorubrum salipaludis]
MHRRRFLRRFAAGGALLTAGCSALRGPGVPFRFAVVNRRERAYHVDFTLRTSHGDALVDGAADVAPRPPGDDEYAELTVEDLARVRNGDEIDARVRVDGRTYEETYEVTCAESDAAESALFFRIRHPEAPASNPTGMEFGGSEC